jgi:hypothetical protein
VVELRPDVAAAHSRNAARAATFSIVRVGQGFEHHKFMIFSADAVAAPRAADNHHHLWVRFR